MSLQSTGMSPRQSVVSAVGTSVVPAGQLYVTELVDRHAGANTVRIAQQPSPPHRDNDATAPSWLLCEHAWMEREETEGEPARLPLR